MEDVRKYVWYEDRSSGYIFWNMIFNGTQEFASAVKESTVRLNRFIN